MTQAFEEDDKGNAEEAIELYSEAVELCLNTVSKSLGIPQNIVLLREKSQQGVFIVSTFSSILKIIAEVHFVVFSNIIDSDRWGAQSVLRVHLLSDMQIFLLGIDSFRILGTLANVYLSLDTVLIWHFYLTIYT